MWPQRISIVSFVLLLVTCCTYGPEEERVSLGQIVGVGDSYQALIVTQYERFRPPTGLAAFPDGGKSRVVERRARLYLVDASKRSVSLLTEQAAPDSLWESFSLSVRGLMGDTVSYLHLSGCPKNGECYPGLRRSLNLRVTRAGQVEAVAEIPAAARLPGVMLARREGEEHYVRFSSDGNIVTARFEEGGSYEPLLEVGVDGSLAAIGS